MIGLAEGHLTGIAVLRPRDGGDAAADGSPRATDLTRHAAIDGAAVLYEKTLPDRAERSSLATTWT
jgi:hypothetical protein